MFYLNFLLKSVSLLFICFILLYVGQDSTRLIAVMGLKMSVKTYSFLVHKLFTLICNHGIRSISANYWVIRYFSDTC